MDKYTWVDIGSSFLPGEISAAFLWAQMEEADAITERRLNLWRHYHDAFEPAEREGKIRRPFVPAECVHNAHMYYLLTPGLEKRTAFIERLRSQDIHPVFHYVPLHASPMGRRLGRPAGGMDHTRAVSDRLVRMPLWLGLEEQQPAVIAAALAAMDWE